MKKFKMALIFMLAVAVLGLSGCDENPQDAGTGNTNRPQYQQPVPPIGEIPAPLPPATPVPPIGELPGYQQPVPPIGELPEHERPVTLPETIGLGYQLSGGTPLAPPGWQTGIGEAQAGRR